MKTILLFLLTLSVSAQTTKTVLKKGSIYNWKIERMNSYDSTRVYFTFDCLKSANSSGMYIGIVDKSELKSLINELRVFACTLDNLEHYQRYDSFSITRPENSTKVLLTDCLGGYLYLSRTSAKGLATEIENNINLMSDEQ